MTLEEEVVALRAENATLRAENERLRAELAQAPELIAQLQARIAELERRKTPPPPFVRPDTPQPPKPKPRKKRASLHNAGRPREEPTQIVLHALERCPDCGYRLRGQSVARTRQVIELPEPPPVSIIEHRVLKRHCPVCERWWTPQVDFGGHVLGQGRFGVRLVSLIAYLRQSARLPVRTIQQVLATLHRLHLSGGAITALLRRLHHATQPEQEALLAQARASPIVHMDETGWRENGQNGYVWGLVTPGPEPVCSYAYDRSRAGAVAATLLDDFEGHLVTDYYTAYNQVRSKHQRCWSHLLRDLHTLKEDHAAEAAVVAWAQAVRTLYDEAHAALDGPTPLTARQRALLARPLNAQAFRLGVVYAGVKGHPCQALARRLLRHQGELFEFVRVPGLDANNNRAERLLRPLVIGRKISGGTRSPAGTAAHMGLRSLFATWQARGLNPFQACLSLLHSRLPQT
jgi:transposase